MKNQIAVNSEHLGRVIDRLASLEFRRFSIEPMLDAHIGVYWLTVETVPEREAALRHELELLNRAGIILFQAVAANC